MRHDKSQFTLPPGLKSLIDCLGLYAKERLSEQLGKDAVGIWGAKHESVEKQIQFVQDVVAKRKALTTKRPKWANCIIKAFDVAIAVDTFERSAAIFAAERHGTPYEVGALGSHHLDVWYIHGCALCDKTKALIHATYGEMLQNKFLEWEERRNFGTKFTEDLRKAFAERRDRLSHTENTIVRAAEDEDLLDAFVILGHFDDVFMKTYYESRVPIIETFDTNAHTDQLVRLLDNEYLRAAKDVLSLVQLPSLPK